MTPEILYVVVTALLSPLFLKLTEYVLGKSNENARTTREQLAALGKRVDELRDKNVELLMQVGIVQSENKTQKLRIEQLEAEVIVRDKRINELEHQVENLTRELEGSRK